MHFYVKLISIFFFLFKSAYTIADDKIVFIDLNYILNESDSGKIILTQLNNINSKNLENFKIEETKLKKEKEQIKKLKNILAPEEYNKKVSLYQKKVNVYQKKKTDIIKSFEQSKNKELNNFFDNLNKIMNIYMKEKSINVILDKKNIVMANIKNDISKEILILLNNYE